MSQFVAQFFQIPQVRYEMTNLTVIRDDGGIDHYDVDWLRRERSYFFHLSGCGGKRPIQVAGIYWASPGVRIKETPSKLCNPISSKEK
jgi:hypothetical protein